MRCGCGEGKRRVWRMVEGNEGNERVEAAAAAHGRWGPKLDRALHPWTSSCCTPPSFLLEASAAVLKQVYVFLPRSFPTSHTLLPSPRPGGPCPSVWLCHAQSLVVHPWRMSPRAVQCQSSPLPSPSPAPALPCLTLSLLPSLSHPSPLPSPPLPFTQRWAMPLGLVVQPMADESKGRSVPVVNLGSAGIVRCRRCRTYMNPYVQWTDGGRR